MKVGLPSRSRSEAKEDLLLPRSAMSGSARSLRPDRWEDTLPRCSTRGETLCSPAVVDDMLHNAGGDAPAASMHERI